MAGHQGMGDRTARHWVANTCRQWALLDPVRHSTTEGIMVLSGTSGHQQTWSIPTGYHQISLGQRDDPLLLHGPNPNSFLLKQKKCLWEFGSWNSCITSGLALKLCPAVVYLQLQ